MGTFVQYRFVFKLVTEKKILHTYKDVRHFCEVAKIKTFPTAKINGKT